MVGQGDKDLVLRDFFHELDGGENDGLDWRDLILHTQWNLLTGIWFPGGNEAEETFEKRSSMRALIVLALLLLLVGCHPETYVPENPDVSGTPSPAETAEVSKAFWRATLGSSGGVTGGGSSLTVWSDGSVFELSRLDPNAGLETKYLGQVSQAKVGELQKVLSAAEAETYQEYGNMTTTLVWQQEGSSRRDWAWEMGDSKLPAALKAVEKVMSDLTPASGEKPLLVWGDAKCDQGRVDFLIGQGQQSTLTLWCEDIALTADVKGPVGGLKELVGFENIFIREHEGTLKVTDVQGGWISGTLDLDGKQGRFRLPAWVTVAP